jgi:hypothetical protein
MAKKEVPSDEGRRNFLKLAATVAPVAAVTAVSGGEANAALPEVETKGLRKTPHVQAYLDSARF